MRKLIAINANELQDIIGARLGKPCFIAAVDIASAHGQWNPHHCDVGIGGVLTLYLEVRE
jgi:hypothetical protein